MVGELLRRHSRPRGPRCDRLAVRSERHLGGIARMQVVMEEAVQGLMPVRVGINSFRQFCGVGADQVVKGVPSGPVLGDQSGAGQLGHQPVRLVGWSAEQAGGGSSRDVSGRLQRQQPEKAAGPRAEVMVRP